MQVWFNLEERLWTQTHSGHTLRPRWEVGILPVKVLEKLHILGICKLWIGIIAWFLCQISGSWRITRIAMIFKEELIMFGVITFIMVGQEEILDVPKGNYIEVNFFFFLLFLGLGDFGFLLKVVQVSLGHLFLYI